MIRRVVRYGDLTLHVDEDILVGPDTPTHLPHQRATALLALMTSDGPLSRADMIAHLWPGDGVERVDNPNAITSVVMTMLRGHLRHVGSVFTIVRGPGGYALRTWSATDRALTLHQRASAGGAS
jgi:DNA-binding winged helix-turn-helix (wHTH) protein